MKQNKIKVAINANTGIRNNIIARILIESRLALTTTDAKKLIQPSMYNLNVRQSYLIAVNEFNFRESPITTQQLYELAAHGICVVVGTKKLPPEMEFICEAYYQ